MGKKRFLEKGASMKGVSLKLEDEIVARIEANYPNLNFAAKRLIPSLPYLRRAVLDTLKDSFSQSELKYMIDMRNGVVYEPKFSIGSAWLAYEVSEADRWDKLGKKWQVDAQVLSNKVLELTPGQIFFLIDWIDMFWTKHNGKNLEEYVNCLIT